MQVGLAGLLAVDDPLVQVGGPQSPDATGELDVVAVVHLGQVVEGPGLLRVGQHVGPALVGDLDEALFDVDVGRSVLAHRAQLDQVDGRITLGDGVQQVEGAHHVVDLGVDGVLAVDHRVGSRALLGEVHDRLGLEALERVVHEVGIGQVADEGLELEPRHLFPHPDPVLELADGDEAVHPHLVVVLPANEIVDHTDVMSTTRQVQRRRPSQIPVTTEHEDPQPCHLLLSAHLRPPGPSECRVPRAGAIRPRFSGGRSFPCPSGLQEFADQAGRSLGAAAKRPVKPENTGDARAWRGLCAAAPRCLA